MPSAGLPRLLLVGAVLAIGTARAEEGMWPLQLLPAAAMRQQFGVDLTPEWLARVQGASVRLASCSAAFVSADGLLLTNQHCVRNCLAERSSRRQDLVSEGYLAATRDRELQCSSQVADVLLDTEDVTATIVAATRNLDARAANVTRKKTETRLEQACEEQSRITDPGAQIRCETVALYAGGQYYLYRYRRYVDLRLVFAPELAMAAFGGDPDNFQYPRWDLDVALLRAYGHDGAPAHTPAFLHVDFHGPKAGQAVFVVGNPGSTYRELTVAQLLEMRDVELPHAILRESELRGRLIEFSRIRPVNARIAQMALINLENILKIRRRELDALLETDALNRLRREESDSRARFESLSRASHEAVDPWEQIARAQESKRLLSLPYAYIEGAGGFDSLLFSYARTLVRGAEERSKPNEERLREYTDGALPRVEQTLRANVPVYADLEELTLSFALARMREFLGPDYPLVHRLFAKESPEGLTTRLIASTRLADPAYRMQLWSGGAAAVDAARDPMIELARSIDPAARALRKRYEEEVEAPVQTASEQIARARFAASGTTAYPDANFTLRVNAGTVQGWREGEAVVAPFTQLHGLFARANDYEPFQLPTRWLDARKRVNSDTPLNLSSSNDIVGGNSGSPLLDAQGDIVGVVFDGNIHSIAGAFWYDPADNRAVAVDSAAMLEALRVVYRAHNVLSELGVPDN
ncbi:MAG TPA: S46 family peptidase [Steroidobacteraceae bacterium]|nr:S46 family peptidase [Steroidobacteraceae bacterium]